MPSRVPPRSVRDAKSTQRVPSGQTGQEALYLRFLSEKQVPVSVKLRDGEVVTGWIEYFDDRMIRLTREGLPNLFIYKEQIRTISESPRREQAKRKAAERKMQQTIAPTSEGETPQ
jgi:host factor-I protein